MEKKWLHFYNLKYGIGIKLLNNKWIITVIIFAFFPLYSLYNVGKIVNNLAGEMTITNVLMYQFGLYSNIYLLLLPLYIFLIGDIIKDEPLNQYVFFRYKSRKSWWYNKVCILFIVTFIYMILAWGSCIFIASFSVPINTNIGISEEIILDYSIPFMNVDFLTYNVVFILIIMFVLLFLSFFTFGLFLSIVSLFFKDSIIPYSIGIVINFLSLLLVKNNINLEILEWLLGYKRIFLQNQYADLNIFNSQSFVCSILYWIIIILIIFGVSLFILRKIDMNFRKVGEHE